MNGKKPLLFQLTKNREQTVNNYHVVSLLPSANHKSSYLKIFLISWNNLLNNNQSGFRSIDYCINQLISITHCSFCAFDANLSTKYYGLFLDL